MVQVRQSAFASAPLRARRCACGDSCAECRAGVEAVVSAPAQPLAADTRATMERRFAHDFGSVRVHADDNAARSADALDALAYTVGTHVVLGAGHSPEKAAASGLLAHELAHVVQQDGTDQTGATARTDSPAGAAAASAEAEAHAASRMVTAGFAAPPLRRVAAPALQKAEKLGTMVTQAPGVKRPFKKISATFDGATFTLLGDGKAILTAAGQSGRPNTVNAADAKACGGAPTDSYLNNPRYVGIKDNGPIPEGEFTFTRASMMTFTGEEQLKMSLAGEGQYVDPAGLGLHGDWGAARAALRPVRLLPSKFCGSTAARSGFYLHGGVMPGSSGCIDVGNDAITKVVDLLNGYPDPVHVFVKYTAAAPNVGAVDRALGRFMYPTGKNPTVGDRLKSLFGVGD